MLCSCYEHFVSGKCQLTWIPQKRGKKNEVAVELSDHQDDDGGGGDEALALSLALSVLSPVTYPGLASLAS